MLIRNRILFSSMDCEQLPAGDENHWEWLWNKYCIHTHHTYNDVSGLLLFRISVTEAVISCARINSKPGTQTHAWDIQLETLTHFCRHQGVEQSTDGSEQTKYSAQALTSPHISADVSWHMGMGGETPTIKLIKLRDFRLLSRLSSYKEEKYERCHLKWMM